MVEVKICGLREAAHVDAALEGGARYIGLVFFEKSPRHVSFEHAAVLAERARERADVVAVTVDAPDDVLNRLSSLVKPDWIQAHGAESAERLANLRRFARKGVIKAFGVAGPNDLAGVAAFAAASDMFLFDAKPPPGADRPGGNALAFDWALLKGRAFPRPWLLSGGLNPENIGEAIRLSGAGLVDVSSGVESAPGVKDAARIRAFLAGARAAG